MVVNSVIRALAIAACAVTLANCATTSVSRAPAAAVVVDEDPLASVRAAIRDALLARKAIAGPSQDLDRLLVFYGMRNFEPTWTGSADKENMAREARTALALAHEHGLPDEDYALPRDGIGARYDLALTDAVLRYASDVRTGRTRPNDIYEDIDLPVASFDAQAALSDALAKRGIAKFLADLPPPHPEYGRLLQALAQYRAIEAQGGWPSLPAQNEIRLERKDPRLSVLIQRLAAEDSALAAIADPSVAEIRDAVRRFQARNGIAEDGRVRGVTLAVLNVPVLARVAQISANMERWRWLPRTFESRYVTVNVPDQSVQFARDGELVLNSRAIVGRSASRTPILRTAIKTVVVNPPWNIPGDIAARDLLPKLRRNPNYLVARNMVVTDGLPGDPHGRKIDWRKIEPAEFPYAIRQLPGPQTGLGALMLDSPNDFDVYLHDTPDKNLFTRNLREISNGCVRVQDIFSLASLALTDDPKAGVEELNKAVKGRKTQRIELENPLPVYFLYWTAMTNADGSFGFRPDRYGRDMVLISALGKTGAEASLLPAPQGLPAATEADDLSP